MTTYVETVRLPFVAALEDNFAQAAPAIADHFSAAPGTHRYQGTMHRVWRRTGWRGWLAAPFLHLLSRADMLFGLTGDVVAFELENVVAVLPDGRATMTWTRLFHFPQRTQRFHALMFFDPERRIIIDRLGKEGWLEVALEAWVDEVGAMCIRSGHQILRFGWLHLPLPALFAGRASVREWQNSDGTYGIRVTIHNPLLGDFFGYVGTFQKV